jgi:hypothetical protein
MSQTPEQQSVGRAHTSPGWMQNELPSVQVPSLPQSPEQQSAAFVHLLPAVLHDVLSVPQVPFVQEPLQHCAALVHFCASDTQVEPEHLLPTQLRLQQSVGTAQAAPDTEHSLTTDAHLCALASHTPEQHSSLCTQVSPKGLQRGPPLAPPSTELAPLSDIPAPPADVPVVPPEPLPFAPVPFAATPFSPAEPVRSVPPCPA